MRFELSDDAPISSVTSASSKRISVRGCRVHNLRDIDLDLPRGKLIAFCGLSGSGKTSLALDTLYAEGQRCYIESFSAYTRRFLQRLDKPDCDSITGIPPAVAVTRAGGVKTNRSTVATATEIADHLRLLFAKSATLFCTGCGRKVTSDDPTSLAQQLSDLNCKSMIGFPVWLPDRKSGSEILLGLQQDGYLRLIVNGAAFHLSDSDRAVLAKKIGREGVECVVVVDRVSPGTELSRLTESLEAAMAEGHGKAVLFVDSDDVESNDSTLGRQVAIDEKAWQRRVVSDQRRCDACDLDYPDPVPRLFNFSNPLGACEKCEGFGELVDVDLDLVVPDKSLSIAAGAIAPWNTPSYRHELEELLELSGDYDLPTDVPFSKLTGWNQHLYILTGHGAVASQFLTAC